MTDQLEFWLIVTVAASLVWRRYRRAHNRGRRSLMVGRLTRHARGPRRGRHGAGKVCNPQSRRLPRSRVTYTQRDLERAYKAGHDTGAAEGPTDETRRRWQREGFEVRL